MNKMIIYKNKNLAIRDEVYPKIFQSVLDSFKIEGLEVPEKAAIEIARKVKRKLKQDPDYLFHVGIILIGSFLDCNNVVTEVIPVDLVELQQVVFLF